MFTRVFVIEQKLLMLGENKQYFGGHRPRKTLQWQRVCNFVLEHNPCSRDAHFSLGGGHKQ